VNKNGVLLDIEDSVVIVLEPIEVNGKVQLDNGGIIVSKNKIPFAHKIACKDIDEGDEVIKYNSSIGYATKSIKKGEWVHVHNIDSVGKGVVE